jgi:transposase
MKRLTEKGEYVLMDSTAVFSRSENVSFLELEHNSKGMHIPQINVMMLFSADVYKIHFSMCGLIHLISYLKLYV